MHHGGCPRTLVEYARLRDLTILSVPESSDQWYAEAIIFGSGRPTLILPESPRPRPFQLGTVAVAWDFSRAAARAVSDALPMLELAKKVRIVTVINEKALDTKRSGEELAKNLARHGIDVVLDKVDAKGRIRSARFSNPTRSSHGADLLVMGAYGHSGCGSSCLAARPGACCRSRRCRSCSRTRGVAEERSRPRLEGWSPRRRSRACSG